MMRDLLSIALIYSTVRLATPLLLAALGGMFSERAGIINIALEGLMLAGAFTAATVTHYTGSPWIGLTAAVVAGLFVALLHAVACIEFKADQVVSGTAINIMFLGVPALIGGAIFDSTGATPQIPQNWPGTWLSPRIAARCIGRLHPRRKWKSPLAKEKTLDETGSSARLDRQKSCQLACWHAGHQVGGLAAN